MAVDAGVLIYTLKMKKITINDIMKTVTNNQDRYYSISERYGNYVFIEVAIVDNCSIKITLNHWDKKIFSYAIHPDGILWFESFQYKDYLEAGGILADMHNRLSELTTKIWRKMQLNNLIV